MIQDSVASEFLPDLLSNELHAHAISSAGDIDINRKFGKGRTPGKPRKPTSSELDSKIPSVFQDKHMTHTMREAMAVAIMQGTHDLPGTLNDISDNINNFTSPIKSNKNIYKMKSSSSGKERYQSNSFLELESNSSLIPELSPKKFVEQKKLKLRNDKGRSKLYTWAGKSVNEVPYGIDPFPKYRPSTVDSNIRKNNKTLSLNRGKKLYKDIDKRRNVEVIRDIKRIATEEKDKRGDEKSKEIEIRKHYLDFRSRLKKKLEEMKNPQTPEILRCIDDSMVHHFVQKYKGMAMTVDAIISFLVTTVGSSGTITPMDGSDIHPAVRHRVGWVPVTGLFSPERLTESQQEGYRRYLKN